MRVRPELPVEARAARAGRVARAGGPAAATARTCAFRSESRRVAGSTVRAAARGHRGRTVCSPRFGARRQPARSPQATHWLEDRRAKRLLMRRSRVVDITAGMTTSARALNRTRRPPFRSRLARRATRSWTSGAARTPALYARNHRGVLVVVTARRDRSVTRNTPAGVRRLAPQSKYSVASTRSVIGYAGV